MPSDICNLTSDYITGVNDANLTCNGETQAILSDLVLTGITKKGIEITNARISILVREVSSESWLKVSGSDVTVIFEGQNTFMGVWCDNSNLTLQGVGNGQLVTVNEADVGLGVQSGQVSSGLTFVNGSFVSWGGNHHAGIGTGFSNGTTSFLGELTILDGNVTGKSTTDSLSGDSLLSGGGSGIGPGSGYYGGNSSIGQLTIKNGNVTGSSSTSGDFGGSGIGTGSGYYGGNSSIGQLTIENGNVTGSSSTSGDFGGSGIGTGSVSNNGISIVSRLDIFDGSITLLLSGIGIGTAVGNLTVRHGVFDCSGLTSARCFDVSNVWFDNGSVVVITGAETVGSSSNWQISGNPMFYFEYIFRSSEENFILFPLIHLNSISLPYPTVYVLTIRATDSGFERNVVFNSSRSTGCAFSVPDIGNYTISFKSASPSTLGGLRHEGGFEFSAEVWADNFYENVTYLVWPTPVFDQSDRLLSSETISLTPVFDQSDRLFDSESIVRTQLRDQTEPFSYSQVQSASLNIIASSQITVSDDLQLSQIPAPSLGLDESRSHDQTEAFSYSHVITSSDKSAKSSQIPESDDFQISQLPAASLERDESTSHDQTEAFSYSQVITAADEIVESSQFANTRSFVSAIHIQTSSMTQSLPFHLTDQLNHSFQFADSRQFAHTALHQTNPYSGSSLSLPSGSTLASTVVGRVRNAALIGISVTVIVLLLIIVPVALHANRMKSNSTSSSAAVEITVPQTEMTGFKEDFVLNEGPEFLNPDSSSSDAEFVDTLFGDSADEFSQIILG
jgi:hypothetical protein